MVDEHEWKLLPADKTWTNVWSVAHWGFYLKTVVADQPYFVFECRGCETRILRTYWDVCPDAVREDRDEKHIPTPEEIKTHFEGFCTRMDGHPPWIYSSCQKTADARIVRDVHGS